MLKTTFTSALKTSLNALLQLDPASAERLRKLENTVVTIEILPFHFLVQLLIREDGVYVQDEAILEPDVTIRGTPLQMTALALNQDQKQKFFAEDITIEGNAELAQDVLHLFNHLHIDWEELLSNIVGDAPAYHAGQLARRASRWLRGVEQSFTENVSEYVHEEAQWFPTREALQDFFNDIDTIRMDVDRLEARMNRWITMPKHSI